MQDKKDHAQNLIMDCVVEGLRKVQLSANLGLVKPRAIIDSSKPEPHERISIYANSDIYPVMSLGLDDARFLKWSKKFKQVWRLLILWKRLGFSTRNSSFCLTFKVFTSPWIIFIYLPFRFRESQILINIRNHDDNNCFEICFELLRLMEAIGFCNT